MSKRAITVVLAILCIAGIVGSAVVYMGKDRKGPTIQVPAEEITYYEGEDTAKLLEGVTAVDDKDKDVTDTLMIEKIIPSGDGETAQVVYAAMDKSNNVTKAYRTVKYAAEGSDAVSNEAQASEGEAPAETPVPTDTPTPAPTSTPAATPVPEQSSGDVLSSEIGTELVLVEPSNVRQAPTTDSEVIVSLEQGAVVEKQGTSGEWIKVAVGGVFGYIRSDLLAVNTGTAGQ